MFLAACGASQPPPPADTSKDEHHDEGGPQLVVQQELGSIDERAVEKTFDDLSSKLTDCQAQGRSRVEYLAGDVKVYLRIDPAGRVKYGWFEDSSLGDRETERCLMDVFQRTSWPKPVGGEADVRHGFGFDPAGERPPSNAWGPEKIVSALDDHKDVKKDVQKCKSGVKGDFKLTAYVVHDDAPPKKAAASAKKKPDKHEKDKHGGKFQAIGVAAPGKEGADKVDCVVDALRSLELPDPGSYAVKVQFLL
ncbi:MAG TPA: AgmX/PglI C-terminal domain-containing protein [Labilithrix sp.]|jgi:hypothetical protein